MISFLFLMFGVVLCNGAEIDSPELISALKSTVISMKTNDFNIVENLHQIQNYDANPVQSIVAWNNIHEDLKNMDGALQSIAKLFKRFNKASKGTYVPNFILEKAIITLQDLGKKFGDFGEHMSHSKNNTLLSILESVNATETQIQMDSSNEVNDMLLNIEADDEIETTFDMLKHSFKGIAYEVDSLSADLDTVANVNVDLGYTEDNKVSNILIHLGDGTRYTHSNGFDLISRDFANVFYDIKNNERDITRLFANIRQLNIINVLRHQIQHNDQIDGNPKIINELIEIKQHFDALSNGSQKSVLHALTRIHDSIQRNISKDIGKVANVFERMEQNMSQLLQTYFT